MMRSTPRRQQTDRAPAQPDRAAHERTGDGARRGVAEGAQEGVVEQGERPGAQERCERARIPGGHEVQCGVGDTAPALVPGEVGLLVGVEAGFELLVGTGDVLDAHVPSQRAVVDGRGDRLVARHPAPPVGVDPAFGDHDERAQHVAHVVVADVVAAVHPVDAPDRRTALLAVEAVLDDGVEQQRRVVVPLLWPLGELGRFGEQSADARHGVGAVERQFQGAGEVPGELVGRGQPIDLGGVLVGIHVPDPCQ